MKRYFTYLILLCFILVGCNRDDKEPHFNVLGYWNISSINTGWTNEVLVGEKIEFQERYIFNDDGTFIKFSTRNQSTGERLNEPAQALGVYESVSLKDSDNVFELTLTFETNMGMAANCGGNVETLVLTKENKLINNSWTPCDGPSFVYQKKQ
ncbi:hypothetical protein ACFSKL_01610 [Belliella marina]|uniref:Lipocalin-like domain-containing protein n=1 Tax=Belliella marina TaxID=1644146 RepID=A0ABW4VIV4_9BACT